MDYNIFEVFKAEGKVFSDKISAEEVKSLIDVGKIKSLYADLKSLDEFHKVRWWSNISDNVNDFGEFESFLREGYFSLENDFLGCLLQTINFYTNDPLEYVLKSDKITEEGYEENIKRIKSLGFDVQGLSFLGQNLPYNKFMNFFKKWYDLQDEEKMWNPAYVSPTIPEPMVNLMGEYGLERALGEVGTVIEFGKDFGELIKLADHQTSSLRSSSGAKIEIVFPFDGWTLAECFKKEYELKK